MSDPRIPLKQPILAGLLAFLVPGAGHLYQGRYFKAAIYFVCITGLFLAGMRMSDGKAMYLNRSSSDRETSGRHTVLRFAAQFGVGAPALWALVQRERFYSPGNEWDAGRPQSYDFEGTFELYGADSGPALSGRIDLEPYVDEFGGAAVRGRFTGTDETGAAVDLELSCMDDSLDRPIGGSEAREFECRVLGIGDASGRPVGTLEGYVPRPFWNWFGSPMRIEEERELHRKLGKFHELAMVFTWVAGLLNLLAIWDAVEGPAYGYGDEPEPKRSRAESDTEPNESSEAAQADSADARMPREPAPT